MTRRQMSWVRAKHQLHLMVPLRFFIHQSTVTVIGMSAPVLPAHTRGQVSSRSHGREWWRG